MQLTLLLDQGKNAQGPRWQAAAGKFDDLAKLLAQTVEHPALVILGAPGSGKSTLLRHYELEVAQTALASPDAVDPAPLTLYVELNRYRPEAGRPPPAPMAWLETQWKRRAPGWPPLRQLLAQRRVTLLLDALNEMPGAAADLIEVWREFLRDFPAEYPGQRVVFSCRSLDYSASLSSEDLPVPQVRLEALADDRVREFLSCYAPQHGGALWQNLRGTPQLEAFRIPYYLRLLIEQSHDGKIPRGRAGLFTNCVRVVLRREIEGANPLFHDNRLLAERDRQQLTHGAWASPFQLPGRGQLVPALVSLAFQMQRAHPGSHVRVDLAQALAWLGPPAPDACLKAACDLGLLDQDLSRDEVCFFHQLLQEFFAARHLARHPDPQLLRQEWAADRVQPGLDETLAGLADADPLPPLPATGWEETAPLAAAMAQEPERYVRDLVEVNLPLAGRCAAEAETGLPAGLKHELQQALLARSRSEQADLRARIEAARSLGKLGDPRFEGKTGPHGEYLLPRFIPIPAGRYPLGSDEGDADERPVHHVELAAFAIAQFPVTNAEWALFLKAGGYEDERWWETAEDRAWRRGESTAEGPRQYWRDFRKDLQANPRQLDRWLTEGKITSVTAEDWKRYLSMTETEFEQALEESYPAGRQTQPRSWSDASLNHPSQPVVGICWHEARAYAAWLTAQTGDVIRLPTEAQWEAAARGLRGRRYPYGDTFDPQAANTFESHIRCTTPIGIYRRGDTPEGVGDLSGSVWEWTSSLYRPYRYSDADGREEPLTGAERRVLRGGSWSDARDYARAAFRGRRAPIDRHGGLGVRLVRLSPIFR